MMTFDSMSSSMTESMTCSVIDPANKLPLKRLEPTIQRFTKIALPTDLERLSQHKKMIKRYTEQEDWDKLNTEQINARLTVQQLKANIREMDKARCQIRDEDLPQLDNRVNPLKDEAVEAIASFLEECGIAFLGFEGTERVINNQEETVEKPRNELDNCEDMEVLGDEGDLHQSQLREEEDQLQQRLSKTKLVEETWNKLKRDLETVSSIIQDFAAQVKQQGEMTDRIEDNVDSSQSSILEATKNMIRVSKLKNVLLPLSGAVIGTAVGGPIGLMVGYKVGAVAAFGGGALGFLSARIFKRRANSQNDADLDRLEEEQQVLIEPSSTPDER